METTIIGLLAAMLLNGIYAGIAYERRQRVPIWVLAMLFTLFVCVVLSLMLYAGQLTYEYTPL